MERLFTGPGLLVHKPRPGGIGWRFGPRLVRAIVEHSSIQATRGP